MDFKELLIDAKVHYSNDRTYPPEFCVGCYRQLTIDDCDRRNIESDDIYGCGSMFETEWDIHCPYCSNKIIKFAYGDYYLIKN